MAGIETKKIKRPYVLVKEENDTIFVKKSNDKRKVIKYVNKGDYWYTKLQIKEGLHSLNEFCEKFICKDTVIEYLYLLKFIYNSCFDTISKYKKLLKIDLNNLDSLIKYKELLGIDFKRLNDAICIHTRQECIYLVIQDTDIQYHDNPFTEIKEFARNYQEIFPPYYPHSSEYKPRFYVVYEKHIEKNIFSIYEIVGEDKKQFAVSKKMNSLGEFDNKGMLYWW
ncbi:MAG: hypothetical protein LBR36_01185 [Bacteroidales bacterium]|nr:hypothetical protein [Bacteroidales bacterium]